MNPGFPGRRLRRGRSPRRVRAPLAPSAESQWLEPWAANTHGRAPEALRGSASRLAVSAMLRSIVTTPSRKTPCREWSRARVRQGSAPRRNRFGFKALTHPARATEAADSGATDVPPRLRGDRGQPRGTGDQSLRNTHRVDGGCWMNLASVSFARNGNDHCLASPKRRKSIPVSSSNRCPSDGSRSRSEHDPAGRLALSETAGLEPLHLSVPAAREAHPGGSEALRPPRLVQEKGRGMIRPSRCAPSRGPAED